MIAYLLKSGLCLALLLAFYHLVLEREKMHQFNRFYLLGSVLFSFIAPLISIYVEVSPEVFPEVQNIILPMLTVENTILVTNLPVFDWSLYILILYIMISTVFLVRFLKNLYHIIHKINTNKVIKKSHACMVLVDDAILPHTFWNYIFINKKAYNNSEIEEELFTHELAHVTQRHTLDVLLVEILQILFWFNPLFFILKKAVQLNHEFLADDKVITAHQNISGYQHLLVNKAAWNNNYQLASNLNYSLTKKRLLMMKTSQSKAVILWKKLALLPLAAGLVVLFANRVAAQTKKEKPEVVEVTVKKNEATKEQMKAYTSAISKYEKDKTFKRKEVIRLKEIYNQMSDKQRATVKNINELLPPPPKVIKIKEIPPPPPAVKKPGKHEKILVKEVKVDEPRNPDKKRKIKIVEYDKEKEVIEIKETPEQELEIEEIRESIEVPEIEDGQEVEEIRVLRKKAPNQSTGSVIKNLEKLAKEGAVFYIDGKKASARKALNLYEKKENTVKDIDVIKKSKEKPVVKIRTKERPKIKTKEKPSVKTKEN